jgi:PAS domain S-box-containing protein
MTARTEFGAGSFTEPSTDSLWEGPGEMRALCAAVDWSSTPLGPVANWPVSLRTTVATVLASRHPMFLWWGPDLVQICNDAYRPSFGQGGRHLTALGARGAKFWTEIWDIIGPQIDQVLGGGESTWHEDQLVPIERNGQIENVWWTYGYSPAFDDSGAIAGVLVVCQETTVRVLNELERSRLREETARAERRAARVLEQVSDEHLTMDSEFRILSVNDAALRALGKPKEELLGRTHWEAFPASIGTVAETQYRRAMKERVEVHFANHYVGEGYDRYLEVDAYPTDEGGIALFWRDVSERTRAEASLRDAEARLRAIYDGTYEYIGLLSPEGTVLEANRASLEFARNTRDDVVGRPFWDTPWFNPTPGAPDQVEAAVAQAARGEFVRYEADLRRPTGEMRTFDLSLHPIRDEKGNVVFIVPEGRDVTERKQAEQKARAEVEEAYRVADAANRAKSEFLAVMSHELRTPLNAIGGYAELMEMGIRGAVTPEQREDLRRIQASQRHLLGLINEVLNYAKLETGTVHYEISDLRLDQAVSAAEHLVSPQARAKRIELVVNELGTDLIARGDGEKVRQILVNLLSNAVKFTDAGGRIEMSCMSAGAVATITVSDSGIGIPADKIETIFDPFVQVRADLTRPHEGTGLGLAISRDLARGMKGELTAQSVLGKGSVFALTLPLAL